MTNNLKKYFNFEAMGMLVLDENGEFFSIEEERKEDEKGGGNIYHFIRFPTQMGISGSAFNNKKIMWSNQSESE
jgi:hypothetical protein